LIDAINFYGQDLVGTEGQGKCGLLDVKGINLFQSFPQCIIESNSKLICTPKTEKLRIVRTIRADNTLKMYDQIYFITQRFIFWISTRKHCPSAPQKNFYTHIQFNQAQNAYIVP